MPGPLDLTGQKLKLTYQRVVQYQSGNFYDGLGNIITTNTGTGGGTGTTTIAINGENYITISAQTITAHPISLASSNVTGRLPFSNITQIPAQLLLGNPTNISGNIIPISIGTGLEFAGNSTLQLNLNYLSSRRIYNEKPFGIQNGINNNYSTANNFITNTSRLFYNGQRLKIGSSFDYIEVANSGIQLSFFPLVADILIIDYDI